MIDKKGYLILLMLTIIFILSIAMIATSIKANSWKNRYIEKNELSIDLKGELANAKDSLASVDNMLVETQNDLEKLSEWATNTYCEVMVGNAYINLKGHSYNRVTWKLFIDRKLITRPPMTIVDCR